MTYGMCLSDSNSMAAYLKLVFLLQYVNSTKKYVLHTNEQRIMIDMC